jgi:alkylation response protein AidB-like acyl-CoA dehydrogenase
MGSPDRDRRSHLMTATLDAGNTDNWSDLLRSDVREWVAANWDPALSVPQWWSRVAAARLSAPQFASDKGGRGLPPQATAVVKEEFLKHGALPPPGGLGMLMAAPTMLTHGTAEQIERLVTPILDGSVAWCQLFSEPGAGSDLAGLTTRAVRDGDRYIINGQKVWSSQARESDYGMLLARTDFDVPKHAGISWFAFPLDQPGVDIRPLREMTGHAIFNEVFLDDAVVPAANLIGGEGNGWAVTQTTLYFERTGIGAGGSFGRMPNPGPKGGMLTQPNAGEAVRAFDVPSGPGTISLADLVKLAHEVGRADDPLIREKLAVLACYTDTGRWTGQRAREAEDPATANRLANLGKLAQTRIVKLAAEIGVELVGAEGMLWPPDGTAGGRFSEYFAFSSASSIYGGTDQIQRNVISERVLGLPREAGPARTTPYREVLEQMRQRGEQR